MLQLPNITRIMHYDAGDKLSAMEQTVNGSTEHYVYGYKADNSGRLGSIAREGYSRVFEYEGAGRLFTENIFEGVAAQQTVRQRI